MSWLDMLYCFSGILESVTWQFHCCLASEHCHFEISPDTEDHHHHNITVITATLGKDLDYFNAGQSALPLRIIEDHELTPFHSASQSNEYMETTRLHEAMFTSTQVLESIPLLY